MKITNLFCLLVFAVMVAACSALDRIGPAGNCTAVPDTSYIVGHGKYGRPDTLGIAIGPYTHCRR